MPTGRAGSPLALSRTRVTRSRQNEDPSRFSRTARKARASAFPADWACSALVERGDVGEALREELSGLPKGVCSRGLGLIEEMLDGCEERGGKMLRRGAVLGEKRAPSRELLLSLKEADGHAPSVARTLTICCVLPG